MTDAIGSFRRSSGPWWRSAAPSLQKRTSSYLRSATRNLSQA